VMDVRHNMVCLAAGLLAGLAGVASRAQADAIVAMTDWNDGSLANWSENQAWVTIANPGSGGITNSGFLQVTLDETDPLNEGLGEEWYSLVQVSAADFFTGEWKTNQWFEFNLWASNTTPDYVQVRWSADPGRVWRDTVFDSLYDNMGTQSWEHLRSSALTDYSSWDYGGGTQEQFLNDLAAIDWVGVFIWRDGAGLQVYGIDDFALMVPEPSEWLLLAVAGVISRNACRRKRKPC